MLRNLISYLNIVSRFFKYPTFILYPINNTYSEVFDGGRVNIFQQIQNFMWKIYFNGINKIKDYIACSSFTLNKFTKNPDTVNKLTD